MSQFRTTFTVKRKTAGAYVNGKFTGETTSDISIQASVQPLRGEEVQLLPEGRRNSQAVKIYTSTQLNAIASGRNPDRLVYMGSEFEILTVEPWQSNVISHYKCIGVKV